MAKPGVIQTHRFPSSTRVVEGWYNPSVKEIVLRFPDGITWWYRGCSQVVWDELCEASSPGTYLREHLDHYRNGPA